jgi:hypothetical protein
MALIHAKEKEHAAIKLTNDAKDHMETATMKWTRIVEDVEKAGFSQYHKGAAACKNK